MMISKHERYESEGKIERLQDRLDASNQLPPNEFHHGTTESKSNNKLTFRSRSDGQHPYISRISATAVIPLKEASYRAYLSQF